MKTLKPRVAVADLRVVNGPVLVSNSWRAGKTTSERGYGWRWQKARFRFLSDNPLCVYCSKEGRTGLADVVDHKIPHRGDDRLFWDEANWQPLCRLHHDSTKKSEESKLA
jgi:5-methylcytosine-specific restriction protein A